MTMVFESTMIVGGCAYGKMRSGLVLHQHYCPETIQHQYVEDELKRITEHILFRLIICGHWITTSKSEGIKLIKLIKR